jgi:hypothetical protein
MEPGSRDVRRHADAAACGSVGECGGLTHDHRQALSWRHRRHRRRSDADGNNGCKDDKLAHERLYWDRANTGREPGRFVAMVAVALKPPVPPAWRNQVGTDAVPATWHIDHTHGVRGGRLARRSDRRSPSRPTASHAGMRVASAPPSNSRRLRLTRGNRFWTFSLVEGSNAGAITHHK